MAFVEKVCQRLLVLSKVAGKFNSIFRMSILVFPFTNEVACFGPFFPLILENMEIKNGEKHIAVFIQRPPEYPAEVIESV